MKIAVRLFFLSVFILVLYLLWPSKALPDQVDPDRVLVYKSAYRLELWSQNQLLKTYRISLGQNPVGHKQFEGDSRTPEGRYTIDSKNPHSAYHLNLGISYPGPSDKQRAQQAGKNPGSDIKIHGLRNGWGFIGKLHRLTNWTDGCIAVTNKEIEELYHAVDIGTPIEIKP